MVFSLSISFYLFLFIIDFLKLHVATIISHLGVNSSHSPHTAYSTQCDFYASITQADIFLLVTTPLVVLCCSWKHLGSFCCFPVLAVSLSSVFGELGELGWNLRPWECCPPIPVLLCEPTHVGRGSGHFSVIPECAGWDCTVAEGVGV